MILRNNETLRVTSKNGVSEYGCHYRDGFTGEQFSATLNTDDTIKVRHDFEEIESIEILTKDNLLIASSNNYKSLCSFQFMFNGFTNEMGEKVCAISITLAEYDTTERLKRIEDQLNPSVDMKSMTLEEFKQYYISKLGEQCTEAIVSGCDIKIGEESLHFSYTLEDQLNIEKLFKNACVNKMAVSYHPDKKGCRLFNFMEFLEIYKALESNALYHKTYCNMLNTHVRSQVSKSEIVKIVYGEELEDFMLETFEESLKQNMDVFEASLKAIIPENISSSTPETGIPQ